MNFIRRTSNDAIIFPHSITLKLPTCMDIGVEKSFDFRFFCILDDRIYKMLSTTDYHTSSDTVDGYYITSQSHYNHVASIKRKQFTKVSYTYTIHSNSNVITKIKLISS